MCSFIKERFLRSDESRYLSGAVNQPSVAKPKAAGSRKQAPHSVGGSTHAQCDVKERFEAAGGDKYNEKLRYDRKAETNTET